MENIQGITKSSENGMSFPNLKWPPHFVAPVVSSLCLSLNKQRNHLFLVSSILLPWGKLTSTPLLLNSSQSQFTFPLTTTKKWYCKNPLAVVVLCLVPTQITEVFWQSQYTFYLLRKIVALGYVFIILLAFVIFGKWRRHW